MNFENGPEELDDEQRRQEEIARINQQDLERQMASMDNEMPLVGGYHGEQDEQPRLRLIEEESPEHSDDLLDGPPAA